MPKINLLEKHVAELIAAGEVIERPSSIVKELLENAIDAGATMITVEIKDGGVRYLRITDNGCGIESEDVPNAFLRHATSKVKDEQDLDRIGTLGFRGEALASISAVARVEMLTKTADAQFGTRIRLEGGEVCLLEEAGCADGTTVIVRDLFYNVPARLKFLKKDFYEAGLVSTIADKIALSHPHVSIKLIRDNKVDLHTPGDGDILSAIYSVFGKDFAQTLIPVDYSYQGIRIFGFSSIPDRSRVNRKSQHFFVNGRYVKTRTCAGALEEAYRHSIMAGKFPACVLYLEMAPDSIDVNVHPTKTEIRFVNEKMAYDATFFAAKSAISEYSKRMLRENRATEQMLQELYPTPTTPQLDYPTKAREFAYTGEQTVLQKSTSSSSSPTPPQDTIRIGNYLIESEQSETAPLHVAAPPTEYRVEPRQEESPTVEASAETDSVARAATSSAPFLSSEELRAQYHALSESEIERSLEKLKLCGELFKTYILAEIDNNFLIIDKHAAHERIIYEKLKQSHQNIEAQLLLTPLTLNFSQDEYRALLQHKNLVAGYGFEISDFGKYVIQVRSIPIFLDALDATQVLYELGCNLRKNRRDVSPELIDEMFHSIACKAAIKANDNNGEAELLELVKEVYRNEQIRYCPHGRPVVIVMSKYELEKKFHRIV